MSICILNIVIATYNQFTAANIYICDVEDKSIINFIYFFQFWLPYCCCEHTHTYVCR